MTDRPFYERLKTKVNSLDLKDNEELARAIGHLIINEADQFITEKQAEAALKVIAAMTEGRYQA